MPEYFERVHVEGVVLELTQRTGAVIVYTKSNMRGENIEVVKVGLGTDPRIEFGANVVERIVNGRREFAAVFPRVPADTYSVFYRRRGDIKRSTHDLTVFPGEVAEVDWR